MARDEPIVVVLKPLTNAERELLLAARGAAHRSDLDRARCALHVAVHRDDYDAMRRALDLLPDPGWEGSEEETWVDPSG